MREIVGSHNLNAINHVANSALKILNEIQTNPDQGITTEIKTDYLYDLAKVYLYLHRVTMAAGIIKSPANFKKSNEIIH